MQGTRNEQDTFQDKYSKNLHELEEDDLITKRLGLRLEQPFQESENIERNGYSWVVLTCCCIIYTIVPGGVKSFGMLYMSWLDYYEAGAGNTAGITSVLLLLYFGLGPIANYLCERFTYRLVMTIGSFLILIGYTASAFVSKMEYLYLTYGVIVGIGYGLMFAPCSTILMFYFQKRKRGFVMFMMLACGGLGNMAFPYMYTYLISKYSLPGTLLISGAIYFHVCAANLKLRQPPQLKTSEQLRLLHREKDISNFRFMTIAFKEIFKFDLFKIRKYAIYLIAFSLQAANSACNKIVLPGQIRALGFDTDTIALSVSVAGASEIGGRIVMGIITDKCGKGKSASKNISLYLFLVCSSVCAVSAFCIPHVTHKLALLSYAGVIGAFSGTVFGVTSIIVCDCVGLKNVSPAVGLTTMFYGISICIAQPFTGWLKDLTGSWTMSFYFLGILSLMAVLLCLVEQSASYACCRERKPIEKENTPFIGPERTDGMNELKTSDVFMTSDDLKDETIPMVLDRSRRTSMVFDTEETFPMVLLNTANKSYLQDQLLQGRIGQMF